MNRRELLTLTARAAMVVAASAIAPAIAGRAAPVVQAETGGRLLRGTPDGRLLQSEDQGKTWQVIAKFGEHCAIRHIEAHHAAITLGLEVQGHHFTLHSTGSNKWYTAGSSGSY
jgi:hypothetical protein